MGVKPSFKFTILGIIYVGIVNLINYFIGCSKCITLTDVSLKEISPLPLECYDDNNHIEISGKRLMIERLEDNKVQIQQKD